MATGLNEVIAEAGALITPGQAPSKRSCGKQRRLSPPPRPGTCSFQVAI